MSCEERSARTPERQDLPALGISDRLLRQSIIALLAQTHILFDSTLDLAAAEQAFQWVRAHPGPDYRGHVRLSILGDVLRSCGRGRTMSDYLAMAADTEHWVILGTLPVEDDAC